MADLIPGILDEAAQKRTWKFDPLMVEFAWDPDRENRLVERVAAARELGVSYGQYMAMLRDGAVADPLTEDR